MLRAVEVNTYYHCQVYRNILYRVATEIDQDNVQTHCATYVILVCTPTKCNPVGFPKGREGAPPLVCGDRRGCNLLGVLDLMRIIDYSDGLRWAFGTWVFKKTCTLMACDVPLLRSCPSLEEVQHENQSNIHFGPQLLGSWVVKYIVNCNARGGFLCALVPPRLVPEEQVLWESNTCECGMC